MNMAISDLLYPVVYLPYCLSIVYLDGVSLVQGIVGIVLCNLSLNAPKLSNTVSILSMIAVAIDRFHGVFFPLKPSLFSPAKCRLVIMLCWLVAVVICSPLIYVIQTEFDDNKQLYCVPQRKFSSYKMAFIAITVIIFLCVTLGCALVLTVLYSSIVVHLYRQKIQLNLATEHIRKRAKMNRRITWMLLTVVIVFYLVWIQSNFLDLSFVFSGNKFLALPCLYTWVVYEAILPFYSVVNPVVYYIFNQNYRQGFKDLLCCRREVTVQSTNRDENARQINYAIELARNQNQQP